MSEKSEQSEQKAVGPIGTLLAERFRIDRLVGNGGMATVYQATDVALGRTVAVKLFRADNVDAAGPERQSGEVAVLASLNHFALVTLFDASTAVIDGALRTFIVMEFIDGSDLHSRIAGGPLEPTDVAEMGADLAEALHYVHSRGIIHRDIKPANVLLAPSGFPGRTAHAKLADFGIARLLDQTHLTAVGTLLGTASYLSPEQALGTLIGPPSDVYSLGLVLLECLTGERAYPGTAVESAMARLQRQPRIPTALGQEWGEVLGGMTSREPADRLSASDAAIGLRRLVAATASDATGATGATGATIIAATTPTALLLSNPPAATAVLPPDGADAPTLLLPVEPTAATVVLRDPAGGMNEAQGDVLRVAPDVALNDDQTLNRPAPPTTRKKRIFVSLVVTAAALIAIFAIVLAVRPSEPSATPHSYPAVDGTLGTHLQQLQESVTP